MPTESLQPIQHTALSTQHSSDADADARAAWHVPYATTPHDIWTRTNVGEVFPNVITPLTWSFYGVMADCLLADPARTAVIPRDLFVDGQPPLLFAPINGRLWYNAGMLSHVATGRFGLPSWFYSLSLGGPREGERLRLPERPLRPLKLLRAAPGLLREQARLRSSIAEFYRNAPAMRAEAVRLRAESLDSLDTAALLARADRILERAYWPYKELLDGSAAALNAYGTLAWLVGRWLDDRAIVNDLVTGLANLLTAQASVALWEVADAARSEPTAQRLIDDSPPSELLGRLRAQPGAATTATRLARFFDGFGHRAADEFELAVPRWSEDPAFIVATLRRYLGATSEMDPRRLLERQRHVRREAESKVRRALTRSAVNRVLPWRWAAVRGALVQARRLLPLRENPKHHFLLYIAELRRTSLALGARLTDAGLLDQPGDVFFLMRPDLERAARGEATDLRPAVAAQRRLHARFLAWQPPEVILSRERAALEDAVADMDQAGNGAAATPPSTGPPVPASTPTPNGGRLAGIAASGGTVTARARVARTPEEGAEIEPGEVLVAPFTDPGWTPLFTIAGAIVMDLGGLLSHGAIVAREYGIPAVVNTRDATTTLTTGQTITVNGSTGEVTWE